MAKAKNGDTVKVHYTGKLDDGVVFDSSVKREPLQFTLGGRQVIPGFEEAVVGMEPGQSLTVTIEPLKAYGPYRQEMIQKVNRAEFPPDLNPQVGEELQAHQPNGQVTIVRVIEADETNVTLDANQPLAGKNLTFDIELVEIV